MWKVQQSPLQQSCGKTDTSHTLVEVQDGPSPMERSVGISGQTMCAFIFGPSHPTPKNLLEIKKYHLYKVIHYWVALLKVSHDSQQKLVPK